MKKWIEKDGKHVLVVEICGTEKEILELEDDILFDDLGEAKKEFEKRLFEYIKNTISELQSISEMLEA